jgi:hypothetical protein
MQSGHGACHEEPSVGSACRNTELANGQDRILGLSTAVWDRGLYKDPWKCHPCCPNMTAGTRSLQ